MYKASKRNPPQNPSLLAAISPTATTRIIPDASNKTMLSLPLISPNTKTPQSAPINLRLEPKRVSRESASVGVLYIAMYWTMYGQQSE